MLALFIFGLGYNALVGWGDRKGYLEGFTWLAVAVGCAVTLGGVAIIDWHAALITLIGFVASGIPMAFGAIVRYVTARRAEQERERQAATLAE